MDNLKFSICLPTYNAASLIDVTLKDILGQTYGNYEVIIFDNNSNDNTREVVLSFEDERVKFFKNEKNFGYAKNLDLCLKESTGDIIFLMSAKSRLSKDALLRTYQAFKISEDIGAVTRPYYWFGHDVGNPVRAKKRHSKDKNAIVSVNDDIDSIIAVFETLDNPAGLAYRRKYMDIPFSQDPFVEFTYPFASIFKKHKVVILSEYIMACPAWEYSGSQNPAVYEKSPMKNWIGLFDSIFGEQKFSELRSRCIKDFVATNYVGLVQIKNYAPKFTYLLREIFFLIKYRWLNLFNLQFWFFSIGTIIMPRSLLIPLVAFYKDKINSKVVESKDNDICLKV